MIKITHLLHKETGEDNKIIEKFNKNNNLIYSKKYNGEKTWSKYDENNNCIYYKEYHDNGCIFEEWTEYDKQEI